MGLRVEIFTQREGTIGGSETDCCIASSFPLEAECVKGDFANDDYMVRKSSPVDVLWTGAGPDDFGLIWDGYHVDLWLVFSARMFENLELLIFSVLCALVSISIHVIIACQLCFAFLFVFHGEELFSTHPNALFDHVRNVPLR